MAETRVKSVLIGAFLCAMALSLIKLETSEARYLPTRSDETDIEVLKQLIKGVLAQASMEQQLDARFRHQSQWPAARQQQFQVERRAMEMPVRSDGDALLAPGFMVADPGQQQQHNGKIKLDR